MGVESDEPRVNETLSKQVPRGDEKPGTATILT